MTRLFLDKPLFETLPPDSSKIEPAQNFFKDAAAGYSRLKLINFFREFEELFRLNLQEQCKEPNNLKTTINFLSRNLRTFLGLPDYLKK
jgi:hypothetical protein